jgi:peroxiredoxin
MALVESHMLPLGTSLPNIESLAITNGIDLPKTQSELTVLAVICNHCPYVIHIIESFANVFNQLQNTGINAIAISSNNVETHPQDAPEHMNTFAKQYGFSFPYAYDATQAVAKELMAECTPDFYVFHKTNGLIYRGQFCDSRIGNDILPSGKSLLVAIETYLATQQLVAEQKPSIGCSIKWK